MAGSAGERVWREICAEDSWNNAHQVQVFESFLKTAGLYERFADFALERSNIEKVSADQLDVEALKSHGYSLTRGADARLLWVRRTTGLELSIFSYGSEDEAWRGAHVDATANGLHG